MNPTIQTIRPTRPLIKPPSERKAGLDLLRAVAILLVVFHHGHAVFLVPFIPLPDGVDLFFVLSGYLIGGILIKGIARSEGFTVAALRVFWLRRWFRTLPAYAFVLLLNTGLFFIELTRHQSIKASIKQMVWVDKLWTYCFFIQNLFTNLTFNFFPESWSLSVEEWFYLLLPLLLMLFLRLKLPIQQTILWAVLIIIIVPTGLRYVNAYNSVQMGWMMTRMVVFMRLDAIGFGVLMAYISYYKPALWKRMASSGLLLVGGLTLSYAGFLFILEGYAYFNSVALTNVLFFTLTSIGVMLLLPALSQWQPQQPVSGENNHAHQPDFVFNVPHQPVTHHGSYSTRTARRCFSKCQVYCLSGLLGLHNRGSNADVPVHREAIYAVQRQPFQINSSKSRFDRLKVGAR